VRAQRPHVFIATGVAEHLQELIAARCDVTAHDGPSRITQAELIAGIADADGVLANPQIPFPAEVIDAAPRLRAIANIGVGYDNVDLAHASARGIAVANTPGVLSDAVADLVMAMLLHVTRRIAESERILREGRWQPGVALPLGADPAGKTLAVIGMGRIGQEVAARALAFKMRVVYYDARGELTCPPGVECAPSLDAALREGDFVTLHVDLNTSSRRLIGERELSMMKPAAVLINTARGGVVDQAALCTALAEKRIAGAALDVLEHEPPHPEDPILGFDNVYLLPHIGSATVETRAAMAELAVRNLLACLHGEPCECVVNAAALA
jgi:glyoxylate reductase